MWSHILADQLQVAEDTFWTCVREGTKPDRGEPEQPGVTIPASLVYQLVAKFHVPEGEVAAMTKGQAIERLKRLRAQSDD